MDGGLFAFGYEVEKPRGLFERRRSILAASIRAS